MAGAVNIQLGLIIGDFVANAGRASAAVAGIARELNGNLAVAFSTNDRNARIFNRGIGRAAEGLVSFGKTASIASAGLGLMGVAAFKSYGEIDGMQRALKVVAGSTQAANKQFSEFVELAKLPGLGLDEVTQAGLQLETLGYQAQTAEKYVSEIGNAIALDGKGKVEFGSVITQFTQMSGKAKVLAEDLKPIVTASPVIAKAINDMFGTVDSEKISATLQAAGRGPKEFIADLVASLSRLERVSGGPKNALENLSDSMTIAGFEAGKAADNAFGLTSKIDGLGNFVSTTATKFGLLSPSVQATTFALVGTAAAIPPLAVGIGTLIGLGPQFVLGFGAMKTAVAALATPLGAATVGIAATVGVIATLGGAINNYSAGLETSADRAKIFAGINDQVASSISNETAKLSGLLGIARDETISKKARLQAVKDLNALSPQYLGNINLETINSIQATKAINQYAAALRLKAKVQVLSQQSAESEIALERARAKSAKEYVDQSRFSKDQIAINIKTTTSFNPQADQARLFDELGKARKNAEVSRLADAAKIIDAEYKKAFEQASKQNIEITPPKVKPFDYSSFLAGNKSGIKQAKDELKALADEIASDNRLGIDTTAKTAQYNQLKAQIKEATAFTREQKVATEGVGSAQTTNERILKRITTEIKEQGKGASESLKNQAAALQLAVAADKARVATLNRNKDSVGEINPIAINGTEQRVKAIVDNVQKMGQTLPGLFDKTEIAGVLTEFEKALPGLDFYRNKLEAIKASVGDYSAKGLTVPDATLKSIEFYTQKLEEADLAILKAQDPLGFMQSSVSQIQQDIAKASLSNLAVPKSAIDSLVTYTAELDKAQRAVAQAQSKADNSAEEDRLDSLPVAANLGIFKVYNDYADTAAERTKSLRETVTSSIRGAAADTVGAFGEWIGGLAAGTASLAQFPVAIGRIFGGLAKSMGQAFITFGTAGLAAKALITNPVTAIIAGVALIALGAGLEATLSKQVAGIGNYAKGGLFTGSSIIRVGENARALAGGGEFVAPVALGADLISARIIDNLSKIQTGGEFNAPSLKDYRPARQTVNVNVGGEFALSGSTLIAALEEAQYREYFLR